MPFNNFVFAQMPDNHQIIVDRDSYGRRDPNYGDSLRVALSVDNPFVWHSIMHVRRLVLSIGWTIPRAVHRVSRLIRSCVVVGL